MCSCEILGNSYSEKIVGPVVPKRFVGTEKFVETMVFMNIMGTVVPTNVVKTSSHQIVVKQVFLQRLLEQLLAQTFVRAGVPT